MLVGVEGEGRTIRRWHEELVAHSFSVPEDSKNNQFSILAVPLSPGTVSSGTRASWALHDGPLLMRNREGASSTPLQESSSRKEFALSKPEHQVLLCLVGMGSAGLFLLSPQPPGWQEPTYQKELTKLW